MKLLKKINLIKEKIRSFFFDEWAGNMTEYALLIGFALFLFFMIITVVTDMLNWSIGESSNSLDKIKNFFGI